MNRLAVGVALVVGAVVVGAAGCSTSNPPSTSAASKSSAVPTTGPTAVATSSNAAANPPSSGGSPGAPDSGGSPGSGNGSPDTPTATDTPIPECSNGQVAVSAAPMTPNKTHSGVQLEFASVGGVSCRMIGYPGVDLLTMYGQPVHAQRTLRGFMGGQPDTFPTPLPVVVKPGHPAHAVLEGSSLQDDGRPCPIAKTILVTPPDLTDTHTLQNDAYLCDMQIHPTGP
ncbi:DUF4232 domain-containing protein [Nocardia sp. CA-129566]|uniref:DUF4232 domain-containing protein n=1 Tax=Nocardia sp. CA-129566 TaxID=3239976 RepID=UPI003D99C35E